MSVTARRMQRIAVATLPIAYRASAASVPGNATSFTVLIPAAVQPGDGLLLVVTSSSAALSNDPAGWTATTAGTITNGTLQTRVLTRVAQTGDAGSTVTLNFSATTKASAAIVAYANTAGVNAADSFVDVLGTKVDTDVSTHTTPTVTLSQSGDWLVSIAADKSSTGTPTAQWTIAGANQMRASVYNTGSGASTLAIADSNSTAAAGVTTPRTFTSDQAAPFGTTWTIALKPGGRSGSSNQTGGHTMLLGICPPPSAVSSEAGVEALEAQIGKMGIRRTYSYGGSVPSNVASTAAGIDMGRRVAWHSISNVNPVNMAAGNFDANLTSFAISVGTHPMYLTFNHEPENDGYSAAQFVAAYNHFYDVVKAANPSIKVGPINMDWAFDASRPYGDPWNWVPDVNKLDFMGLDYYNIYLYRPLTNTNWWDIPIARVTDWLANHTRAEQAKGAAIPVGIGEFASANWVTTGVSGHPPDDGTASPVGTRKVAWIQAQVEFWETRNCFGMCYFDTLVNNPGDVQDSITLESDALSTAYWQAASATYGQG